MRQRENKENEDDTELVNLFGRTVYVAVRPQTNKDITMRQRTNKEKMISLFVKLPESIYNAIDKIARIEQKSKGMLVEEIIEYWLAEKWSDGKDTEDWQRAKEAYYAQSEVDVS